MCTQTNLCQQDIWGKNPTQIKTKHNSTPFPQAFRGISPIMDYTSSACGSSFFTGAFFLSNQTSWQFSTAMNS